MPRLPLPIRPALICAILSPVTLSGCATMTGLSVPTDKVACQAFKPIYWSGKDTADTVAAVKEHNAAITATCPEYKPAKLPAKSDKPMLSAKSDTTFRDRWFEGVKTYATVFR